MQATNPPSLYLNLPTADPAAALEFFTSMGLTPIEKYSDAITKAFLLPAPNNTVCLMVHGQERFKEFIRPGTAIVDAKTSSQCLFSIAVEKREDVDAWVDKAVRAGGAADPFVLKDHGADCGMYTRSFADLDGHIWETVAMVGGGCHDTSG
jgi:predicted lactoylglutathione lyase